MPKSSEKKLKKMMNDLFDIVKKIELQFEAEHFNAVEYFTKNIEGLYGKAVKDVANIGNSIYPGYDDSKPFTFSRFPQMKNRIDKIINNLYNQLSITVQYATKNEWINATKKSDAIIEVVTKHTGIPAEKITRYGDRNLEALLSFQKRKINGLGISNRIWNYSEQFRGNMEMALDVALGEGTSASDLAVQLQQFLKNPNQTILKLRNKETGAFYLSERAKQYSPGTGVYRSSYQNSFRLARTEINMAYRASDCESNKQLSFVVGIEVRRSNHIFFCPVCEQLAGKYPKNFVFTGWHPQCRCFIISILNTEQEFLDMQRTYLETGQVSAVKSVNHVGSLPDGFKQYIYNNKEKLIAENNRPCFVKDNLLLITRKL